MNRKNLLEFKFKMYTTSDCVTHSTAYRSTTIKTHNELTHTNSKKVNIENRHFHCLDYIWFGNRNFNRLYLYIQINSIVLGCNYISHARKHFFLFSFRSVADTVHLHLYSLFTVFWCLIHDLSHSLTYYDWLYFIPERD